MKDKYLLNLQINDSLRGGVCRINKDIKGKIIEDPIKIEFNNLFPNLFLYFYENGTFSKFNIIIPKEHIDRIKNYKENKRSLTEYDRLYEKRWVNNYIVNTEYKDIILSLFYQYMGALFDDIKYYYIDTDGDNTKNFNTGDPLVDWYDYKKFVYNGDAAKEGIFSIGHSSSVDHWFMDSDEYIEKYLNETETGFEFINREDVNNLSFDQMDNSIKCVVSKDMKSFEELKQYYRLNKEITK